MSKWLSRFYLLLSTAPVWVPALVVLGLLHLLGVLNLNFTGPATGVNDSGGWYTGAVAALVFPLDRLPFVDYIFDVTARVTWWPAHFQFGATSFFNRGWHFGLGLGPVVLSSSLVKPFYVDA